MGFQVIQHYAKIRYLAEIFILLYENSLRKAFEAQLILWKFLNKHFCHILDILVCILNVLHPTDLGATCCSQAAIQLLPPGVLLFRCSFFLFYIN